MEETKSWNESVQKEGMWRAGLKQEENKFV